MKKLNFMLLSFLLLFSAHGNAANEIHMKAPIGKGVVASKWIAGPPLYSTWINTEDAPLCTTWAPDPSTILKGVAFTQTSADCQQNQQRNVQAREKNSITQAYRNVGSAYAEYQVITVSQTRAAVGAYVDPGVWLAATPIVSAWTDLGTPVACSNWSPDPSTVANGVSFQQTATDCQQTQQRAVQAREQNSVSHEYRNAGSQQQQNQVITVSQTRAAVGTYVDPGVWTTSSSIISAWTNVGTFSGCSNWSPAPSTVSNGTSFQQTATDCLQVQERTVQKREQNSISHDYRNVGTPTTETQTVSVSSTRTATGTKTSQTVQALFKVGTISTQVGYITSASIGSLISNSNSSYVYSHVTIGFQGQVVLGMTNSNQYNLFESIKIEFLDSSNNVTRVISGAPTQSRALSSPYMEIPVTAADIAASKTADKYRLTAVLK
jgi:hypothetical protein